MAMIGTRANHAGGKNTATIGRPMFAMTGRGLSATANAIVALARIAHRSPALIGLTLSILNCVIELRSSVYPGDPLRPRPLDARVSAALQNAPWPVGLDIQRAVAGYLAMARRVIFTPAEADQRNIRSAGLRTPAGPRLMDVGVDHRGAHVPVAEQFLDGANVVALLQEVRGK